MCCLIAKRTRVGDDDVGPQPASLLDEAHAVIDLPDEISDVPDQAGEAIRDDGVIVSEQNFRTHATLLWAA
jgi:hypothetical protein